MSNPAKPFVSQHAVAKGVVATRWWWVRHAPVRDDGGNIYGQKDMTCDCSDRVVFDAVSKILPRDAVWVSSKLKRTHMTADAIWAAGFPKPGTMPHEADLNEQHLGDWQGLNRAEFFASRPINVGSYRLSPDGRTLVVSANVFPDCDTLACTKARVDARRHVLRGLRALVRGRARLPGRAPARIACRGADRVPDARALPRPASRRINRSRSARISTRSRRSRPRSTPMQRARPSSS